MSQKILASALLLAPAILLTSCGNNEQKAAPVPTNATPEVKKADLTPATTESTISGTVSPTDTQTGTSSMQKPNAEINTAPVMAMKENESSENESESEDESNDDNTPTNKPIPPSSAVPSVVTPTRPAPTNSQPAIVAGASVTKTVHYTSPAGDETVEFTMTTSGDTITAVSAKPLASNPISTMMQTKFSESIQSKVVGKKKSELQLDAVGGASLTTNAFKKFVAQN